MTNETTETVCASCQTVPLSQLEIDPPLGGWNAMLEARGVEVTIDDLGRKAIPRDAARQLAEERRAQAERRAEAARRRTEEQSRKRPVRVGVPGQEGMSPFEAMAAAEGGLVSPSAEFGPQRGNPTQELFEDLLAAGQREIQDRRDRAAARAKERAAAQMKEDLR